MARSFIQELKRRNVFRVALIYGIVGWLLMQVGDVMFPALLLPEWTARMLAAFLILGFPVALVFAWAYEITPEGIKRTEDVQPGESITHATGRKIDFAIIGVLAIAVILLARQLWFDDEAGTTASVSVPEKSIAVLPFTNRSAAEENAEFFAAGMHDDLLTLLSNLGDLKVISRTSVERLDPNLSIPEIGKLLGVATVLEGQVQRAGDQLRINTQLIDAATEDHLWAKTYDRELTATNVFAVQSDIARTIADALHAQLSPTDESRLARVPTENTDALNAYLIGMQLQKRASYDSLRQARGYFVEATTLDPDYVEAWAAIANNAAQEHGTGSISTEQYVALAGPAIERALQLDDGLAMAHAQLGTLKWNMGDFDAAEAAFKKALAINPNDPGSLVTYGTYLRSNNRPEEAIPVLERAANNDPLSPEILFELGKSHMYAGRPEKTLELGLRITEIDPASVFSNTSLIQAYSWMGRYDLMWPRYFKAIEADPKDYESWCHAGINMQTLGAPEWADRYLGRALELGPNEPAVLKCQVLILAQRGRSDEALAVARGALETGLDNRWGSDQVFLRTVRDHALQTGDFDDALKWYRDRLPELFQNDPKITVYNVSAAAGLALLLRHVGNGQSADRLVNAGLRWYRETQPPGAHGPNLGIVDVELLALNGEKELAITTLRQAVDGGWKSNWRWRLNDPNLDSLRDDQRFGAIVHDIEVDLASQLEAIRELPYQGPGDLRFAQDD